MFHFVKRLSQVVLHALFIISLISCSSTSSDSDKSTNPVINPVASDTTAPSTPANLRNAFGSPTDASIELLWDAATDNIGVTGYRVMRDTAIVATTTDTMFLDSTLPSATSYQYTVVAFDAAGNTSSNSNALDVTTTVTLQCDGCMPTLLYSDITSGPITGGENNNGAYLSLFGKNLGPAVGLGTNTKIFINGSEVAAYIYAGPSHGRTDIQQISVQVGPVTSGAISFEVNGALYNSNLSFTVQPGDIIYVSTTGNDTSGSINNIALPYRTVQDTSGNGVWQDVADAGDFIVLREGEWFDAGLEGRFIRLKNNTGSTPTGSVNTGPITIMGYPGEDVHIHSQEFGGISNRGNAAEAKWIVLSNLRIEGGDVTVKDAPINMQWGSDNWRIINNELFSWDAMDTDINGERTEARAGGIAGNGNNVKILGNSIHDIGGGTKNHGIYIDFDGNPATVDNIELAWNYLYNHTGGNLIQLYGSLGDITNVNIHHNLLDGGTRYGFNIGKNAEDGILIWNNIVKNTDFAGFRMDTEHPGGTLYVYNNTFYNVDILDESHGAITNTAHLDTATVEFKNNIIVASPNTSAYTSAGVGSGWGASVIDNNLWHGLATLPVVDNNPVTNSSTGATDPEFVNPAINDFSLSPTSIAIDACLPVSVISITTDYLGNQRPVGGAMDCGAHEAY